MTRASDPERRARLRRLAALAPALDAVERRDAGDLAAVQRAITALDREIDALEAALGSVRPAPGDLLEARAHAVWAAAARERLVAVRRARAAIEPDWEAARERLARSHGEAQAAARLARGD